METLQSGPTPQCPLINTARLKPFRQRVNRLIMTITESGHVSLEVMSQQTTPQDGAVIEIAKELFHVSPDGINIEVYQSSEGVAAIDGCPVQSQPAKVYTYPYMPEKQWRKYQHAYRFVEAIKSRTPKVILVTERAKCKLMENLPCADFQAVFNDGVRVTLTESKISIVDKDGSSLSFDAALVNNHVSSQTIDIVEFARKCHAQCLEIQKSVVLLQARDPSRHLFPITVGSTSAPFQWSPSPREDHTSVTSPLERRESEYHRTLPDGHQLTRSTSSSQLNEYKKPLTNSGYDYNNVSASESCLLKSASDWHLEQRNNSKLFWQESSVRNLSTNDGLCINSSTQCQNTSAQCEGHTQAKDGQICYSSGDSSCSFSWSSDAEILNKSVPGNCCEYVPNSTQVPNFRRHSDQILFVNEQSHNYQYTPEHDPSMISEENIQAKCNTFEPVQHNNALSSSCSTPQVSTPGKSYSTACQNCGNDSYCGETQRSLDNTPNLPYLNQMQANFQTPKKPTNFPHPMPQCYSVDSLRHRKFRESEDKYSLTLGALVDERELKHVRKNLFFEPTLEEPTAKILPISQLQSFRQDAMVVKPTPSLELSCCIAANNEAFTLQENQPGTSKPVDDSNLDKNGASSISGNQTNLNNWVDGMIFPKFSSSPVKRAPVRKVAGLSPYKQSPITVETLKALSDCNGKMFLYGSQVNKESSGQNVVSSNNTSWQSCPEPVCGKSPQKVFLRPSFSHDQGALDHQHPIRNSLDMSVSSYYSDSPSSSPSSGSDPIRQVFVPYTGWASFYATGAVWILYNDGTQLGIKSAESVLIYVDQDGSQKKYKNTDVVPEIVRIKLEKLPMIIDMLMKSPPITATSGTQIF
ncbi:uncharacterized protein LOC131955002 [Physella acuta]|uniref:uncharacterized protein LOC131955002 n=1 Tax=Physella acuta TaxID=109671 RepID=UPI0027DB85C7|nr:uncharacterized protein LOC131955002 [Physella acuta]